MGWTTEDSRKRRSLQDQRGDQQAGRSNIQELAGRSYHRQRDLRTEVVSPTTPTSGRERSKEDVEEDANIERSEMIEERD